ncbi:hypothetical protein P7K49_040395, partial [Saguinus oedipus]
LSSGELPFNFFCWSLIWTFLEVGRPTERLQLLLQELPEWVGSHSTEANLSCVKFQWQMRDAWNSVGWQCLLRRLLVFGLELPLDRRRPLLTPGG